LLDVVFYAPTFHVFCLMLLLLLLFFSQWFYSSYCFMLNVVVPLTTLKMKIQSNTIYNNWYVKTGFENQLV
jgi:hypothetical protein